MAALPTPSLTGWQADAVLAAIEALDGERFADGDSAMMKVERPDLWTPPDDVPSGRVDLVALFEHLKKALPA